MRTLTAAAFAAALAVGLAVPAQAAPSSPEAFQKDARSTAAKHGFDLCRYGSFRFDDRQPTALFALFHRKVGGDHQFILDVGLPGGHRWFATSPEFITPMECPTSPGPWQAGKTVRLGPWGIAPQETVELGFVDGAMVTVAESGDDNFINSHLGWDGLSESVNNNEDPSDGYTRAILLVLDPRSPWRARLPQLSTWVTFGGAVHQGPADAELDARAELTGKTLQIVLAARDDVVRPLPAASASSSAFLKSDHFELWFCAPGKAIGCDRKQARQLGVARVASGGLRGRWLHPPGNKEPLPTLTTDGDRVVVSLPLARVQHQEGGRGLELQGLITAVYSDSDTEGKQDSIIASSPLRWGDPRSFGRFVRLEGGARFPPWDGGGMFDELPEGIAGLARAGAAVK